MAASASARPEYTPAQLSSALDGYYGGPAASAATCGHIHGFGDPDHELSVLQRITATTILDYASRSSDPSAVDGLLEGSRRFRAEHGPVLSLRDVVQARSPCMALAAEFKRASPSKGDIAPHLDAGDQAVAYSAAGACVISVLTEERWFKGSLADLTCARLKTTAAASSGQTARPAILRKDFITSKYQIAEAAAGGADTVLLIVATTPSNVLKELIDFARSIGMEPLVEVHALIELDVALSAGARVLGVNNRNLHTFRLDLSQTEKVAEELARRGLAFHHDKCCSGESKPDMTLCALSGMSNSHDVQRYRTAGVGMCLIGESLMRASDPSLAIRGLCLDPKDYASSQSVSGGAYTAGTKVVKVCGITNAEDALVACRSGASLIGVIFAEKSKRKVTAEQAKDIVAAVRRFGERDDRVKFEEVAENGSAVTALIAKSRALERASRVPLVVGVFQNHPLDVVRRTVEECGLDMVQLHGSEGMEAANSSNFGVPALRVMDIELGNDGESRSSEDVASGIVGKVTSDPIAILLDTSIKGDKTGGGTGKTFDWGIAEAIQSRGLPVIIAGGLTPGNIDEAVSKIRPFGVDVAGGVEASPGTKDHEKVRNFVGGAMSAAAEAMKGF